MITAENPEEETASANSYVMVVILPGKHTLGGNARRKARVVVDSCDQNHSITQNKTNEKWGRKIFEVTCEH